MSVTFIYSVHFIRNSTGENYIGKLHKSIWRKEVYNASNSRES